MPFLQSFHLVCIHAHKAILRNTIGMSLILIILCRRITKHVYKCADCKHTIHKACLGAALLSDPCGKLNCIGFREQSFYKVFVA